MRVLGIDPGKDGFLCLLGGAASPSFQPMPTIAQGKGGKRLYDDSMIASLIRGYSPDVAVIEKQQAMPGQGGSSMFSIGVGFGLLRGVCAARAMRVLIPHPRTWQKVMLRDIPGTDTKARALIAAQRLFPNVDLRATERCRKPHSGKVDALLLAEYGRRVDRPW